MPTPLLPDDADRLIARALADDRGMGPFRRAYRRTVSALAPAAMMNLCSRWI
jgi:hypothetical protein